MFRFLVTTITYTFVIMQTSAIAMDYSDPAEEQRFTVVSGIENQSKPQNIWPLPDEEIVLEAKYINNSQELKNFLEKHFPKLDNLEFSFSRQSTMGWGCIYGTPAREVVTQDLFFFWKDWDSICIKNLGTFGADSLSIIFIDCENLLFMGKNPTNKLYELYKFKYNLGDLNSCRRLTRLFHSENRLNITPCGDILFVEEYKNSAINSTFISTSGKFLTDFHRTPYCLDKRTISKGKILYEIHAENTPRDSEYLISAFSKSDLNKIIVQKTNVKSKNYISDFISDYKNPLNILAIKTHRSASDAIGTWIFLDHEFAATTAIPAQKM